VSAASPKRHRIPLPHGEADSRKRYSMPDPDSLEPVYTEAYRAFYSAGLSLGEHGSLTDKQISVLFALASGYLDLTMYELGQECCVEKLRDIWRARRAESQPPDAPGGR
jgi:hypothetical protein